MTDPGRAINPAVRLSDLAGVWRRVFLIDENGTEDHESPVFWVQARRLCADIREHRRLTALVDESRAGDLPLVDAFAGHLRERDGIFRWDPSLRLRPNAGPPDEGRLTWDGADVREDGVHQRYTERWTRIAAATDADDAISVRHERTGREAYRLRVGRFRFDAIGDPTGTAAFTLSDLRGDAPRVVVSSRPPAPPLTITFADVAGRSAHVSGAGLRDAADPWLVTAHDPADRE